MTKLTKARLKERDALVAKLQGSRSDLEAAAQTFNEAMEENWSLFQDSLNIYSAALEDAKEWVAGIAGEIEEYISDKSEKWQEGDKAQAVQCWLEEFQNISLDEIELEAPSPLDISDIADDAELLEQLPEGADV